MAPRAALLATLAVLSVALVAAAPAPGDELDTSGLSGDGWSYSAPVTSYANTSADVADIIKAINKPKPDWASAVQVFTFGKNAFRNLLSTPPVMRIMGSTMAAVRSNSPNGPAENYWKAADEYKYYEEGNVGPEYAFRPLRDALYGEGHFTPGSGKYGCCGVRQAYASALSRFYGPQYYFHEVDAGVYKSFVNKDGTGIATAYQELDDAVALLLHPRVAKQKNGSLKIVGRVAPGYNFWDWSAAVAKTACAVKNKKADTHVKLLRSLLAAKEVVDPTKNFDWVATSNKYAQALLTPQRHVLVAFVRAALKSAKDASANFRARPSKSKCSTECGIAESHLAAAHAYWYVIESGLWTLGADPEMLKATRDLVDPELVNASRNTFKTFAASVKKTLEGAGYDFKKDVWGCRI